MQWPLGATKISVMWFKFLLAAVFAMSIGNFACAGVIGLASEERIQPDSAVVMSVVLELQHGDGHERPSVEQRTGDDIAVVILSRTTIFSSTGIIGFGEQLLDAATVSGSIRLANSTLPDSPVLDGLLKPS